MSGHTPTPWAVTEHDNGCVVRTVDALGRPIASMWLNGDAPSANAAFIVKAVNSHDMLVATLSEIINYQGGADHAMADEYVVNRARAALAELDPPEPPTANDDGGRGE